MARKNFTTKTKRQAKERSGGLCEAVGEIYGLDPGKRCNMPLDKAVEFDHYILDANSKDNSLENCRAVCPQCHGHKTNAHDKPLAAKTQRQKDKHNGIKRDKPPIRSRRTPKVEKKKKEPLPDRMMPEIYRRYKEKM